MPEYNIRHITRYTYPAPATDSANQLILYPHSTDHQELREYKLEISHQPHVEFFIDYFGNKVGIFSLIRPHTELLIRAEMDVVTHEGELPADEARASEQWITLAEESEQWPCLDFMLQEKADMHDDIEALTLSFIKDDITPFAAVKTMSSWINENFSYVKGITSVETSVDEIWRLRAGVCQDFAHMLLVMLRMAGIPSRYVSGYICPKNHELRGEGATHAWVEAWIPNYGWIGVDPTNNCIVSDRHVRLAAGRDFSDCTPVKGIYKGPSQHLLEVSVVINNALAENAEPLTPVFTYKVTQESPSDNSYRRFMEIQQQQ